MNSLLRRRMLVLICVLALVVTIFAGCAGNNEAEETTAAPAAGEVKGETKAAELAAEVKEEPLDLTWMAILYTTAPPSDVVLSKLEEATNTKLNITWIPDAVKEDKINIALASNTLAKVVTIQDIKNSAYLNAARAGMFWEVGPYLKDYPNLSQMNETILANSAIDGKNYGIYRERDLSRQGIIIRKDWLEKVGLPEPKTLDDLYNVLKAFKEKDPDGNGKNDTFGMPDRNDLKFGLFKTVASYHGTPNDWGLKDGKLAPEFMFDEYVNTMKYVKKLYDEGLINEDFAVSSKQQQWDYFTTEKAGIYIGNMDDSKNLKNTLLKVNPNAQLDLINRIEGPDGKPHVWSQAGHNGVFVFPKSEVKTEEELKRILAFFDKLGEPEMYRLTQLGLESVHYNTVDGKFFELIKDADAVREVDVRPLASIQGLKPEVLKPANDPLKEKNTELNDDNVNFIVPNPAEALQSATFSEKGNEMKKIIDDATYKFILSSIDEAGFQAEIEKWKAQGGDQVIAEYNEAYAKK